LRPRKPDRGSEFRIVLTETLTPLQCSFCVLALPAEGSVGSSQRQTQQLASGVRAH
jgi:hypothetical protein